MLAEAFLVHLADQNVSWSWMASAIAVLRNCFDRLGNMDVTAGMVIDPESQGMIVRQMNVLLARLNMALPARRSLGAGGSLSNGPAVMPTKPQGP